MTTPNPEVTPLPCPFCGKRPGAMGNASGAVAYRCYNHVDWLSPEMWNTRASRSLVSEEKARAMEELRDIETHGNFIERLICDAIRDAGHEDDKSYFEHELKAFQNIRIKYAAFSSSVTQAPGWVECKDRLPIVGNEGPLMFNVWLDVNGQEFQDFLPFSHGMFRGGNSKYVTHWKEQLKGPRG